MWAEARRQCQQEGATLAVVNSELEAQTLSDLYRNDVRNNVKKGGWGVYAEAAEPTTTEVWLTESEYPPDTTSTAPTSTELPASEPAPTDTTLHIGFHDIFIEGEYLTVHSK